MRLVWLIWFLESNKGCKAILREMFFPLTSAHGCQLINSKTTWVSIKVVFTNVIEVSALARWLERQGAESKGRWIVISDRGDLSKFWQSVNPVAVLQNNMSKFPRFSDIIKVRDAHARTIPVFVTNHIPWVFRASIVCFSCVQTAFSQHELSLQMSVIYIDRAD